MPTIASVSLIETTDIEEHRHVAQFSNLHVQQLSPGHFKSRTKIIQIHGMRFYRQQWNRRVSVQAASPDGYLMIGINVTQGSPIIWNGQDLDERHLAFAPKATEMEFTSGDASNHTVLLVAPGLLARYFDKDLIVDINKPNRILQCDRQFSTELSDTIFRLLSKYQANGELLRDAREQAVIQEKLMGILAQRFSAPSLTFSRITRSKRRKALMRAVEYVDSAMTANPQGSILIPHLAKAANVSQRTLEYAFREMFGISAVKYQIRRRLNGLHQELHAADPGQVTVTQIGLNWGFHELGRMAVEYRRLFGESPSTTLAGDRS